MSRYDCRDEITATLEDGNDFVRKESTEKLELLNKIIELARDGIEKNVPYVALGGIRQLLEPAHTVPTTTWSIEDIRDRLPLGTSNEKLFDVLQGIQSSLEDVAVRYGWEVIDDNIGRPLPGRDE